MSIKNYTFILISCLWLINIKASLAIPNNSIETQEVALNFGGSTSIGEFVIPKGKVNCYVLLIAGSGPYDMDATYTDYSSGTQTKLLKDIAFYLASQGIATLRYNKRHVHSARNIDFKKFMEEVNLKTLAADAQIALNWLKNKAEQNNPNSESKVYVYGWSEGTLVATDLAKTNELSGLVLQGAVAWEPTKTLKYQLENIVYPWLKEQSDNGELSIEEIFSLVKKGNLGAIYLNSTFDVSNGFNPNALKLNPKFDLDNNKRLHITKEYYPTSLSFFDDNSQVYANDSGLLAQVDTLTKQPLLIIQGMNDGNTPEVATKDLVKALSEHKANYQYKTYKHLGHSLGKTKHIAEDLFPTIDPQVLTDIANWINH